MRSIPLLPVNRTKDRTGGVALVLILVFLVLITMLVLAFFSTVSTDYSGAKSYAGGAETKQLADSAVQVVMGQIKLATSGDSQTAWASQPGMIRTYDSAGEPGPAYKLYSSNSMTIDGTEMASYSFLNSDFKIGGEGSPTDWGGKPAIFTDLNAPIQTENGPAYPILDPGATSMVPGFNIATGDKSAVMTGPTGNPAAMPVKWIYVLRDGTLTAPDGVDATGDRAAWTNAGTAPTSVNPIVGRIAFWADDETSKVNINTAGEGTYADAPRLGIKSLDDYDLSYTQHVRGEYQRYPGHPATTCLSAVFGFLTGLTTEAEKAAAKERIFGIIPRIGTGGSVGGTKRTVMGQTFSMVPDSDRLYASVDELVFKASDAGKERVLNDSLINQDTLEKAKFFITASSRAPDLNLFGKPRVSVWPLHVNPAADYRSAVDQVIAFCSTMRTDLTAPDGPYRYYFQREDPHDSTHDLPAAPAVTGLGRNRMLLGYLKSFVGRNIPGFGGNLQAKYNSPDVAGILPNNATEVDQILTQAFDYVRATNLGDRAVTNPYSRYGQVVPIEDTATGTRGFGRYRTVQGANMLFIGQVDGDVPDSQVDSTGAALPTANSPAVASGNLRVQAIFLPQLFDVALGSIFDFPDLYLTITGLEQFACNGESLGYSNSITPTSIQNVRPGGSSPWVVDGACYGDQLGLRQFGVYATTSDLISKPVDLPKSGTFSFTGGELTFTFRTKLGAEVQKVVLDFPSSTFPMPKLANAAKMEKDSKGNPIYFNMRYFSYTGAGSKGGRKQTSRDSRNGWISGGEDVIRSVYANPGDMRLIAARKTTPDPKNENYLFAKNAKYDGTADTDRVSGAHTLWGADGYPYPGAASTGKLVKGASYNTSFSPTFQDVPIDGVAVGKKTAYNKADGDLPGDYDTSVAEMRDGPFINKPDEGDMGQAPSNWPYKWKYHIGSQGLSATLFSPNRLIPSAVMFGSLPTGVLANKPWQTLLFRPGPAGHPGLGSPARSPVGPPYTTPPDHLLLDLFSMPVAEPYPISEPLSTAGRINMNYQIAPFTYINRDTGLRAVLKSEKVISILTSEAPEYKIHDIGTKPRVPGLSRQEVNIDETLKGFARRFDNNDLFRSATEICDLDIVPANYTGPSPYTREEMDIYWSTRLLTGDNCRERPYATIYPRLTTKSNSFTVHFQVQTLKKAKGTAADSWDEKRDAILAEFRGSQTIERYVDPSDPNLPDFANPAVYNSTDPAVNPPIDKFYRFRVLNTKRFNP